MNNTVLYTLKFAKTVYLMLSALTTKEKKREKNKGTMGGNFWK